MPVITEKAKEQTYCIDDLRELLDFEDVIKVGLILLGTKQKIYVKTDAFSGRLRSFVTREGLDVALSCVDAATAKALAYLITHGIEVVACERGKVLFNARDVAVCFGYEDPDKAVQRYCKLPATGCATEADVRALGGRSRLRVAGRIRLWIARKAYC